jgi:hypothetical protein
MLLGRSKMTKKIKFNRATPAAGVTGYSPSPALRAIPKWYKSLPKFENNHKLFDGDGFSNLTIKACPPFLDSMMSGYMLYTEVDMHVTLHTSPEGESGSSFEWRVGGELISSHGKAQIDPEQVPKGFNNQPFKFISQWQIITPKGYSIMFTHPQNRGDLPFATLSGTVDTDGYRSVVHFPFFIREDFEGTIPAGTPIAQIHPFKRESWEMELGDADAKEMFESKLKLNHKLMGGYKTQWWSRKEYR